MGMRPTVDGATVVERVAEHVRSHITRHRLQRGAPLPSYRELSLEVGAAYMTVKRGMDLLVEQGVITRDPARGCFVNRELAPRGRPLNSIGIIHPASQKNLFSAPYLSQIMQGINGGATPLDVHIFALREQGPVTAAHLADHSIDGVILIGMENDAYLREFASWGVPGVVADYFADGIPLDFVACDNPAATQRAVRHLVGLGHRHICYVGSDPSMVERVAGADELATRSADFAERRETAIRALDAIPVCWEETVIPRPFARMAPAVAELATAWRENADRATAILADNDTLANRLINELATRGVKVPDAVSVCTVASATDRTDQGLAMTGARFDFIGMGRKAVELLKWRCENPTEALAPAVYRIGFDWEAGETCGKTGNG